MARYGRTDWPLTGMQGRVLFHAERLFRSTGGGVHAWYAFMPLAERVVPGRTRDARTWTNDECALLLHAMRQACRETGLRLFRQMP